MILKRLLFLSVLLLTGLLLNACGQKGPLYMPDEAAAPEHGLSKTSAQTDSLPMLSRTDQYRTG